MRCYLDARRFQRRWVKAFCYKGPVSGLMAALEAALLMEKAELTASSSAAGAQTHNI